LILLQESPDTVRLASDKLARIGSIIQLLTLLPDTYKSAIALEQERWRSLFTAHGLISRFANPLQNYAQSLSELCSSEEVSDSIRTQLTKLHGRILFHKEIMQEHFELLEAKAELKLERLDLHALLTDKLRRRYHEHLLTFEVNDNKPYTSHVRLDVSRIMSPLFIRGNRLQITAAFWNLLENTISNKAISPNIVVDHPDRCRVILTAQVEHEWIVITIEDLGEGIAQSQADALNSELRRLQRESFLENRLCGRGLTQAVQVFGKIEGRNGHMGHVIIAPRKNSHGTIVTVRLPFLDSR
jgi:K+-sensing histidine kinase KdpD